MRRLLVVLAVLVLLGVLFVAADRGANALAEQAVASRIATSQHLDRQPSVELTGFPFLTQVVSGHYDGGRVLMHGLTRDDLTINTLDIRLHGVRLPLSEVLSRSVERVPVDRVRGTALISYAELTEAIGVSGLQLRERDGKLHVRLPVRVPRLGTIPVAGSAELSVDGGRLVISDVQLAAGDVQLPSAVLDAVLGPVAVSLDRVVPLEDLPYGLHITGVAATPDGVRVSVAGEHVVLTD